MEDTQRSPQNDPSRRSLRAARKPNRRPQRSESRAPKKLAWAKRRRMLVKGGVLAAVPALFATVALPAFSYDSAPEIATSALSPEWQRLQVPESVSGASIYRDGYSATTTAELAANRAAIAARKAVSTASNGAQAGTPKYNYTDDGLTDFLATQANGWLRPVAASPTSPYGPRQIICNAAGCSNSFHDGVDLGTSCGTPIRAVSAGRVSFVGPAGSYGNRVIVDHGSGVQSIYGHVQPGSFQVDVGQLIPAGTVVAKVGRTGVVTDCVLDLKMTEEGKLTNPTTFLATRGVIL